MVPQARRRIGVFVLHTSQATLTLMTTENDRRAPYFCLVISWCVGKTHAAHDLNASSGI